jgi:hypothetical protein
MQQLWIALAELGIPFAIAGAMAVNSHGHKRTTADVNILICRDDLQRFKERFDGRGWVDKFEGSRNFRDATDNVNIDTLDVGDFLGDGQPKPVAFPPPKAVSFVGDDGIPIVKLPILIELILASGMTARHRPRDLDDAIQLIRVNKLPRDYAHELNPYVATTYDQMC